MLIRRCVPTVLLVAWNQQSVRLSAICDHFDSSLFIYLFIYLFIFSVL